MNDKVITELIHVVKDLERPLLGKEVAEKLKTKMTSKNPQLFTCLGQIKKTYTITLKEDAKPIAISVPRKVPENKG